jgi:ribosomal protein S18 acetylase RimI-like enzyme
MNRAIRTDKGDIVELLSRSFIDNQSVNYIVQQDSKAKRVAALMDYSFEVCYESGDVWLTEDRKASALVLYPQLKRITLKSVWLDVRLIFQAIGLSRIPKALKREARIKNLQPTEEMLYLWFIGVDKNFQHQGIGSGLLTEIIAHAQKFNLPVYLETSTVENIPWYQAYGFTIYNRLELGYTLYFLKREPSRS